MELGPGEREMHFVLQEQQTLAMQIPPMYYSHTRDCRHSHIVLAWGSRLHCANSVSKPAFFSRQSSWDCLQHPKTTATMKKVQSSRIRCRLMTSLTYVLGTNTRVFKWKAHCDAQNIPFIKRFWIDEIRSPPMRRRNCRSRLGRECHEDDRKDKPLIAKSRGDQVGIHTYKSRH